MNSIKAINNILAKQGSVPVCETCPICGETDRDEFSPISGDDFSNALLKQYGSRPCIACEDSHRYGVIA